MGGRRVCRAGRARVRAREAVDVRFRYRHLRAGRRRRVRRNAQRRRGGFAFSLPLVAFARAAVAVGRADAQRAAAAARASRRDRGVRAAGCGLGAARTQATRSRSVSDARAALSAAVGARVRRVSRARSLHAARARAVRRGGSRAVALVCACGLGRRRLARRRRADADRLWGALWSRLRAAPARAGARSARRLSAAAAYAGVAGAALAGAAAAALLLYFGVVAPRFGGWGPSHFYVYPFAAGPLAFALSPFTRPREFAARDIHVRTLDLRLGGAGAARVLAAALALGAAGAARRRRSFCSRTPDTSGAWAITTPRFGSPGCSSATVAAVGRSTRERSLRVAKLDDGRGRALRRLSGRVRSAASAALSASLLRDLADARRALDCVPQDASLATYDEWFSAVAAQRPARDDRPTSGVQYLVYADDFPQRRVSVRMRPAHRRRGRAREISRRSAASARLPHIEPRARDERGDSRARAAGRRCAAFSRFRFAASRSSLRTMTPAIRQPRRVLAAVALVRLRQRARADQGYSRHAAAGVFEVAGNARAAVAPRRRAADQRGSAAPADAAHRAAGVSSRANRRVRADHGAGCARVRGATRAEALSMRTRAMSELTLRIATETLFGSDESDSARAVGDALRLMMKSFRTC